MAMTVINGIEIDHIDYRPNNIKAAIRNNTPIDTTLHVVIVVSNPCLYASRYKLAREFLHRMAATEGDDVAFYVVELAYGRQKFLVTDAKNPRHLQLRTEVPLWHKENMLNVGIQRLLPPDWKAVAWIDADLEFENTHWVQDTLKLLNGECEIVQLFSHCVDMGPSGETMSVFQSAGYQYQKGAKYRCYGGGRDYWHPGYAWACTRAAYDRLGGLFEVGILGSGDNIMCLSLLGNGEKAILQNSDEGYKAAIRRFQDKAQGMAFGYVPGVIRHYYHGSKQNRKYMDRWKILLNHAYNPDTYLTKNRDGILVPNWDHCPFSLLLDIYEYFAARKEDEGVV
jgi:hypothetical protein